MSARPTTSPATVTVNKFNTSLSQGSILVDFTANTTNDPNASQRPKLVITYTTGGTPSNPAPSITSFSPGSLTPSYPVNSSAPFSVTCVGANGNGSVSIMWNVTVVSLYDVNRDGYVNEADLEVISSNFGQTTYAPYPSYDVIDFGIVDVYDITAVSTNILE